MAWSTHYGMKTGLRAAGTRRGEVDLGCPGCIILVAALIVLGVWKYQEHRAESARAEDVAARNQRRLEQQRQAAHEARVKATKQELDERVGEPQAEGTSYDIEKTLRAVRNFERCTQNCDSIDEFVQAFRGLECNGVDPRVVDCQRKLIDLLMTYWAADEDNTTHERLWVLHKLLTIATAEFFGSRDFGIAVTTSLAKFELSSSQNAEAMELIQEEDEKLKGAAFNSRNVVRACQKAMVSEIDRYATVVSEVNAQWRQLCHNRDSAYLALADQQFSDAAIAAEVALSICASDYESSVLLAIAKFELSKSAGIGSEAASSALSDLNRLLAQRPDCAPALLARGVIELAEGLDGPGRKSLQLASSRYPEQAAELGEALDPLGSRQWLRMSASGSRISSFYEAMGLGAGYFSPELQLARHELTRSGFESVRKRIQEHFDRRKSTRQWGQILLDLEMCEEWFAGVFDSMLPERGYVSIQVEAQKGWFSSPRYEARIDNRSSTEFVNATLVLAVFCNDMVRGDYYAVPFETATRLPPHAVTSLGEVDLGALGIEKSAEDIWGFRGILISGNGVGRIESDDFRAKAIAERARTIRTDLEASTWSQLVSRASTLQADDVRVTVKAAIGADDVEVALPNVLGAHSPRYRLAAGDTAFEASESWLDGDLVRVVFNGAEALAGVQAGEVRFSALTNLGELVFVLMPDPQSGLRLSKVDAR